MARRAKSDGWRQTNHIGAWLRYRGIKQRQLSKKLAVSEGYISEIASNRKNPSVGISLRIAGILKCHVEDLFKRPPK
jgi:transcriptional regulator with XRE-family HTH domain